mgnify:CR=1 FL=1
MKLLSLKIRKSASIVLILSLIFPPQLFAQLANGITIGVKGLALGNAVTADINPSISAVYNNPAGLTRLKQRHFEVDQLIIGLDLDASFYAPLDKDGNFDYDLFGLEGTGFNTYDTTVPRDPVVGSDGELNVSLAVFFRGASSRL